MSLWKKIKFPNGKEHLHIDPKELYLRLRSLLEQGNIEVLQLGLESIVEELEDHKSQS